MSLGVRGMIDKRIGIRVKECRENLNLTQEEFAEKIGVGSNYISLIERGESFPRYEVLIDLINGLETSADYIFQDVLTRTAQYKASELWEKIQELPAEKQNWILKSIENMVNS